MRFIGEVGAKLQLLLCKPGWKGHALLLDLLVATDANVTMGNGASAISLPNWIAQKIVIKQTETTGIAKELGAFRRSDIIQCCAQQSSATQGFEMNTHLVMLLARQQKLLAHHLCRIADEIVSLSFS